MKILIVLLFISANVFASEGPKIPSPTVIKMFASILNVSSKADLEKLRDDLSALDRLECFEGNPFVTNPGLMVATMSQDIFRSSVYKVTPPGFFESLFWGNHASNHYQRRTAANKFFSFPTSVWAQLKNGDVQMYFSALAEIEKSLSQERFKTQFLAELDNLKAQFPGVKFECSRNEVHVIYAKQLLPLLDLPNCESLLTGSSL